LRSSARTTADPGPETLGEKYRRHEGLGPGRIYQQTLEGLISQYPREVEPYRRLLQFTKESAASQYSDLSSRFEREAELRPNDPLALYVAGVGLAGTNTPLSIRLLAESGSLAPTFPWPALELAHIFGPGKKRSDPAKAKAEIAAFFQACPSSADPEAQSQLTASGDKALQSRVAGALRDRLTGETDLIVTRSYETLWELEFRFRSPSEHQALRRQVAADLRRLNEINPHAS
jgi:hypothetical protein